MSQNVVSGAESSFRLKVKPQDLLWATWEKRKPLKGKALKFESEKLWALPHPSTYRDWREFREKGKPVRLSFEEALFWVLEPHPDPKKREEHVERWEKWKSKLSYPLSSEQFQTLIDETVTLSDNPVHLYKQDKDLASKVGFPVAQALLAVQDWEPWLSLHFRDFLLFAWPFLKEQEIEALREVVRPQLKTPEGRDAEYYTHWPLAASLGMHSEVEKVVASWEDGKLPYSDFTAAVMLLGQSSAQLVYDSFVRLDLDPAECGSEHGSDHDDFGRRFMAVTGALGLDIMTRGVTYACTKKEAKRRFRLLALLEGAVNVRPMLEVAEESEIPEAAQKWLMKHHEFSIPEMKRLMNEGDDYAGTAEEILGYLGE